MRQNMSHYNSISKYFENKVKEIIFKLIILIFY